MVSDFLGSISVGGSRLELVAEVGDVVVDLVEPGDAMGLEGDIDGVPARLKGGDGFDDGLGPRAQ